MQRVNIKRLRAAIEPAGSAGFGIDLTGTIGNFTDLRSTKVGLTRQRQELRDATVAQRQWQRKVSQFGFKSVTVDFEGQLVSTNQILSTGVSPTKDIVSKVIESMIGGYSADAGNVIASGASTTGAVLTSSGSFAIGQVIAVEVGSTDRYELTMIKTISGNTLTWSPALSFTPTVGRKVVNGQRLYPTNLLPSACTSVQFLCEGEDRDLIWLAMGCQGPLNITWELGKEVMWSSQFQGAKWLHDDDIATPQGGSPLAAATYEGSVPIPCTTGSMILSPMSGTARTRPHIAKAVLSTGTAWDFPTSFNGVEGKAQAVSLRGDPPILTLSISAEDESWTDELEAGTKYQFLGQAGTVGGRLLGLLCPTLQVIGEPAEEELNGVQYWSIPFLCLENENAVDQSTDERRAPFSIFRG